MKTKDLSLHCLNVGEPEGTIKTLLSVMPHVGQLTAGDLTNSDRLKAFCIDNKIGYVKLGLKDGFADCQNQLLAMSKTPWHMHLYPGETLANPEKIRDLTDGPASAYRFCCIQGGWMNKEVRLYHRSLDCKFTRPVFETISVRSQFADVYVTGGDPPPSVVTIVDKWVEKNPLSLTPRYYKAVSLMTEGKQAEFITAAKEQLFADNTATIDNIMLRYYLACALAGNQKTRNECAKHIVECLAANTLMAEFWCLLGDVYLVEGGYDRATAFYRNAITLGSQRRKDDEWPMHISKYTNHPNRMIEKCEASLKESKMFKLRW